jgi:hypothetical protein
MAGVKAWRSRTGAQPLVLPYFARVSQTLVWGDIVCLCSNTLTPRIKAATDTELQETTPKGILGFVWQDFANDANGQLVQSVPSTVETGAAVIHPVPNYSRIAARGSQPLSGSTPDIGNYEVQVCVFTDDIEVLLDVRTGTSAYQVTQANRGIAYGLKYSGGIYFIDIAVTTTAAAGVITEVDTQQPNFNVSATHDNAVWYKIRPAFQQHVNGQALHA